MPDVITSVLLLLSSIQTNFESYVTLALPEPKRELQQIYIMSGLVAKVPNLFFLMPRYKDC
jgi:hypothetical protein